MYIYKIIKIRAETSNCLHSGALWDKPFQNDHELGRAERNIPSLETIRSPIIFTDWTHLISEN